MKQQHCRVLLQHLESDASQIRASLYLAHPDRNLGSRGRRRSRLREFERLRSEVESELLRITGSIPQWWSNIDWDELEQHSLHSGLACFASAERQAWMNAPLLSRSFGIVADSYHLKPILNWLQNPKGFLLISLRDESIQAFRVTLTRMTRVLHVTSGGDMALRRLARDRWEVPVVLTGNPRLIHEARRLAKGWVIAGELDIGEALPTDSAPSPDLHATVLKKHESITKKVRTRNLDRYFAALKSGRGTDDLRLIKALVASGQIETMYVDETRLIRQQDGSKIPHDDLLDDLAEKVIARHGNVVVLPTLEMPSSSPCAALIKRPKHA